MTKKIILGGSYMTYIEARKQLQIMRSVDELLEQLSELNDPNFTAHINDVIISGKVNRRELSDLKKIVHSYELQQLHDYVETNSRIRKF